MSETLHSLDTSFVIRILTCDPPHLFESATKFIGERGIDAPPMEVCDLVLAEAYFALLHHYGFSKPDALAALLSFSRHPAIAVSDYAQTALALPGMLIKGVIPCTAIY